MSPSMSPYIQLGVSGSAVSSPSRVWGRALAEIEFCEFCPQNLTLGGDNINFVPPPHPPPKKSRGGDTTESGGTCGPDIRSCSFFKRASVLSTQKLRASYSCLLSLHILSCRSCVVDVLNAAREAAIWELEERHFKDKAHLARRQLRDLYFLKRHQLITRHDKVCRCRSPVVPANRADKRWTAGRHHSTPV